MSSSEIVPKVAKAIAGEAKVRFDLTPADVEPWVKLVEQHGVTELLASNHARLEFPRETDHPIRTELRKRSRNAAVREVLQQSELMELLGAIGEARIDVLLLKGAALAHTLYPSPHLRPRGDTDLLVGPEDLDALHEVLVASGYEPLPTDGVPDVQMRERPYLKKGPAGMRHTIDLHWALANRADLRDRFVFGGLWGRSIPVPRLGASARALSRSDALIHAAIHRSAHHDESDRLIWLYDIHLLLGAMSREERAECFARARAKEVSAAVKSGVEKTAKLFGTKIGGDELGMLESVATDVTARYVRIGRRGFGDLLHELRTQPAGDRVAFLRGVAFPSPRYMMDKFRTRHAVLVPWLYFRRGIEGGVKMLRRKRG
ncbi:MAG: nucleotidyltransferase family protein [Thermoanaerobaculia bacterium]